MIKFLFLAICTFLSLKVSAQSANPSSTPQIAFSHIPLTADKIPYPGEEIKLMVLLENTHSFDLPLRAVVVRDGVLMEVPPSDVSMDGSDKPKYIFTVNAPKYDMAYQFLLINNRQKAILSNQYTLVRNCKISTDLADVAEFQTKNIDDPATLLKLSSNLEKDINAYDQATLIIDKIVSLLETGKIDAKK